MQEERQKTQASGIRRQGDRETLMQVDRRQEAGSRKICKEKCVRRKTLDVRRRGRKPRSQAAGIRRQEGQENPGA